MDLYERLAEGPGYELLPGLVDPRRVEALLRLLNLEIRANGLRVDDIDAWGHTTWWPRLRGAPEVIDARGALEPLIGPGQWAEPQLLLRFPDRAATWPLTPHVDEPPPWAEGREYDVIFGLALTAARYRDGTLTVWPDSHHGVPGEPLPVSVRPGDVVAMHPALGHCSDLNRGGSVRYTVYYRHLGP